MTPGVEVVGIELDGTAIGGDCLSAAVLLFAQIAQQVMHLGIIRLLLDESLEYGLGYGLCFASAECALTTETMALDAPEAGGHQLIGAAKVTLGLLVHPQLRKLDGDARLDAIGICKMLQRLSIQRYSPLNQAGVD